MISLHPIFVTKQEASRHDTSAKLIRYLAAENPSTSDSTVEKLIKKK